MYKKLIRYDRWHFTEVDPVRLKRMGVKLRDQIQQKVRRENDSYSFYTATMPIVEAAIRGEITHSLDGNELEFISGNFDHDQIEGTLPPEYDRKFREAVAGFAVTAEGLSLEQTEDVVIEGVTYGWLEFEEEGDWPGKVKHR